MILGTGIDMVAIDRILPWLDKPGLLDRYFSEEEIAYVRSRGEGAAASLAARFAAKEAFGKAMGTGLQGMALRDIRVRSGPQGRPELAIGGTAEKAFRECGGIRAHLSLTHDASLAMAQVIIEGEDHG